MPSNQTHRVEELQGECELVRIVGEKDNPDFEGTWEHYTTTSKVGFYKDKFKRVWLTGWCKDLTGTPPSTIFILPAGYRPSDIQRFSSIDGAGTPSAQIQVNITGAVACQTGNDTFISLDGISWRV